MNRIFTLFVSFALIFGCQKAGEHEPEVEFWDIEQVFQHVQKESTCGESSLFWLHDLLTKAEEDRVSMVHKGNYVGVVSMLQHEGNTYFYTNFMMGSGGIMFYLFDCDGNHVPYAVISSFDFDKEGRKKDNVIYANVPLE